MNTYCNSLKIQFITRYTIELECILNSLLWRRFSLSRVRLVYFSRADENFVISRENFDCMLDAINSERKKFGYFFLF